MRFENHANSGHATRKKSLARKLNYLFRYRYVLFLHKGLRFLKRKLGIFQVGNGRSKAGKNTAMAQSGLLNLLQTKMAYLTQRQGVISQNVANAATPNYKPKDLVSFDDVLRQAGGNSGAGASGGGLQMVATNPMHFGISKGGQAAYKVQTEKDIYEMKPNGNGVVLEQQMSELAQTSTDYNVAAELYRKTVGMLKTAIGRSGGG
jgi:flagellar basal-body rod protein FlgB